MTPSERFAQVRDENNLTQQEFGEILGFRQTKVKDIEIGKQKVSPEIAEQIENIYAISGWWLLTGRGEKSLKPNSAQTAQESSNKEIHTKKYVGKNHLSSEAKNDTLTDNTSQTFEYRDISNNTHSNTSQSRSDMQSKEHASSNKPSQPSIHNPSSNKPKYIQIPLRDNIHISHNGVDLLAIDTEYLKRIFGNINYGTLFMVKATGKSMAQLYSSGDYLIINPYTSESSLLKDGEIYLLKTPNGIIYRRIEFHPIHNTYRLHSDDENYELITLEELETSMCVIIGRVVGKFALY